MSGEAPSRKKKDRRKRKANIEQLQHEEYQEERNRVPLINDEDDDIVFKPTLSKQQEDEEGLLGSGEKSGSGWCVKLVFLLLIGSVSLAIGVVFLEIDANKDLSTLLSASSEKVSSVLEETSARVSSLWDENGSSASSLWETVKESVGLEGDKTPLEDLADKKDVNVEESASVPEAKSEEFFDEGDDYYEDEVSIPVEQPEGVVAPEPVVPADSYVEPPVEPEIVPVQQAPVEDEPPLAEEGENLPTHEEEEEEHTLEQEVLAQITPEHEQESAESVEHTPQEEVLAAVTPEHERLQSLEEEIIQHIPNEEFLAAVTPEHAVGVQADSAQDLEDVGAVEEEIVSTSIAGQSSENNVEPNSIEAEGVAQELDAQLVIDSEESREVKQESGGVEQLVETLENLAVPVTEDVPSGKGQTEGPSVPDIGSVSNDAEDRRTVGAVSDVVEQASAFEALAASDVEQEAFSMESVAEALGGGTASEPVDAHAAAEIEVSEDTVVDPIEAAEDVIPQPIVQGTEEAAAATEVVADNIPEHKEIVEEIVPRPTLQTAEEVPVPVEDKSVEHTRDPQPEKLIVKEEAWTVTDDEKTANQEQVAEPLPVVSASDSVASVEAEGHSSEAEEAPEILEDAPEDFVSTPVASLEEAQSVPQEDVSAEEATEDQSVPLADPLGTHYVDEPQSDEVESQEEVPEIVNNAPEDVVSAPAIDDLDKVQSVPESDVVPEASEEQPHYADSYGNAPTSQEVENEITESEEVETDPEEALKASYPKIDITNDDDWEIRDELDSAEETVSKSAMEALSKFEDLLRDHPNSPRALYGRALALDKLSDKERSNSRLEQAIFAYRNVIDLEAAVPDNLYRLAGKLSVERMKFRGFHGKAIRTQQRLILRFPDDLVLRNELAIVYLTVGQNDAARELLEDILKKWPESGVAKVHYGFILKNIEQKMEEGAKYMQEGIDSKEPLAIDGRFYYHLGDAYERLGKRSLAMKVYEEGAKLGLFRSKDQRSLYNVDRLHSKPFWTKEETTYQDFFNKLEANWEAIRDEGVGLMNLSPPEGFKDEAESLRDTGDWKQFELFARGRKLPGCAKAPKTCALIESFHPASTCKRGQAKFSVMHPGTHVWPHTGPTNCRLRSHLGLKVPEGVTLRVADETSKWEEGKLFIFDDSFDHEVWHNGTTFRLVLIVDVWHPDLTENERQTLTAI